MASSTRDQAATLSAAGDPEPEAEPLRMASSWDSASDHAARPPHARQIRAQRRRAKYVLSEERASTIDSLITMMMRHARDSSGKRVNMENLVREGEVGPKSFFKHGCFFRILSELSWRELFVIDRHEARERIRASQHYSDLGLTSEHLENILPPIVNMAMRQRIQGWFHKICRHQANLNRRNSQLCASEPAGTTTAATLAVLTKVTPNTAIPRGNPEEQSRGTIPRGNPEVMKVMKVMNLKKKAGLKVIKDHHEGDEVKGSPKAISVMK